MSNVKAVSASVSKCAQAIREAAEASYHTYNLAHGFPDAKLEEADFKTRALWLDITSDAIRYYLANGLTEEVTKD